MRWVWLLLGFACACGTSSHRGPDNLDGGSHDVIEDLCNPLTQTGCASGEKCTWIVDAADATSSVGHIGCAPTGPREDACTRNPPGLTGYDDCVEGKYCAGPATGGTGVCEALCDLGGSALACGPGEQCHHENGVFGPAGMRSEAGLCVATCDPLADNNFLGATGDNRTGSACGSGGFPSGSGFLYAQGCYGLPDDIIGQFIWTCMPQRAYSRVHRAQCDVTQHAGDMASCASGSAAAVVPNSCAAGYEPVYYEGEGTSVLDCVALCRPANCYNTGSGSAAGSSSCGTGSDVNITGTAPYQCNPQRLQYTAFDPIDPTSTWSASSPMINNGEQCLYSWVFEFDGSGTLVPSPTSDTVGFCFDHALLQYDPTGGSNATVTWPRCDYVGLGSNGYNAQPFDAAGFGCVDTATARAAGDITFAGKAAFPRPALRRPYRR
jgi:hypothetical protein